MTSFYGSVNGGQGGSGEGIDTSTLMQKNNPTFNGTITGPNARFTGTVQIPEPTEDNHAATKAYVDAALADVDLSEVTTRIDAIETAQDELAAQLDDKVDAENPAFTGTATLDGKNIATVDQIPNISDLPYLDENNPTYTGTLTGADATFSGVVSVPAPTQDGQAVNKQYVDQAIAGIQTEVDLSEIQEDIVDIKEDYVSNGVNNVAKGNPAVCEDSVEWGLQGLKVYGKSTQATTTGAQLFDIASIETDKSYGSTGTLDNYSGRLSTPLIELSEGTTQVSSSSSSEIFLILVEFDSDGALLNRRTSLSVTGTQTLNENTKSIGITFFKNQNVETTESEIQDFMLNAGSTALPFEPYTGGNPSPSPEYPQEIHSAGDEGEIDVGVTGANILNPDWLSDNDSILFESYLLKPGDYTISFVSTADWWTAANNEKYWFIAVYDENNNKVTPDIVVDLRNSEINVRSSANFTLPYGTVKTVCLTYSQDTKTKITDVMLNPGSTARPYEPYQSQSLTFSTPNGLPGIPVDSGGNFVDADGQEWYCNYRDWARGVDVQNLGKCVVDGSTVKFEYNGNPENAFWNLAYNTAPNVDENKNKTYWSSYFSSSAFGSDTKYQFLWTQPSYMEPYGFTTVEELNAFCVEKNSEGKPLIIMYGLTAPIESPIPADELAAYRALHTYDGTTIISSTDSLAEIEFNYTTSNQTNLPYIKNKGDTVYGEYDFTSANVKVANPTDNANAANKEYVDTKDTALDQKISKIVDGTTTLGYIKNTGGTATGVYDFTDATINAADPVDNSNVATKHYVDQKVASAGGAGEVVSYTQGDGISISPENEISLSIDSAGANGLKVGANGLGLDLATSTTPGAMAASDKTAIASNTTEITNIKNGTTELPYLKETNPTYEGTLIGGDATFTGSVQISTPDQDNEAANKSYVDTALAEAKSYTDDAVSGIASDETIQQIQTDIDNIENGTTELPYIKDNGDTVTGNYNLTGAAVTIAAPAADNNPATKKYVDDSISAIDVSEQISPLTERVTAAEGEIDTLQTNVEAVETSVTNIINGTTELPYVKDSGDTVTGTYNFTGANVTIAEPTVSNNPATKNYVDTKIASAGGSGEVVSYTQGNGINISPENVISVVVDADNANGLAVDTNGIKLDVATSTTAGAMSGADKAKLDASSTTEQMNQAISEAVSDLTDGTTELPYVKKSGDTMTGGLTIGTTTINEFGVIQTDKIVNNGATGNGYGIDFSGTPKIYNVNTNDFVPLSVGEPTATGHAATKKYVDDQIVAIDVSEQIEPLTQRVTIAEGEIDTLQSNIINITNGTTELPYIPSDGGTISGPINWGSNPQEATELANKAYVDANDSDAVNSAKEYTNAQIEIAKEYTDEAVTNLTNGTTELPYVTKEEVDINGTPQEVARAYRYTFNNEVDGTHKSSGFGFIDLTPAIVTEVDGSTNFSPLYVGEPEKDTQAATKKYVDDSIADVSISDYTIVKQGAAEDGYFATYYLAKDNVQTGEKINIPKDYLVKEAELLEVTEADAPYTGAVIGDKYIDFTINTQAADEDERHIYLPVKDLVDVYTGGNGVNIDASNVVSVQIDAANANGLAVDSTGLKLNLATTSAAGAMSAADKTKLNTAVSEEQLTAIENEVDTLQTEVSNIKNGTADIGYLKAADPTYTGTLNGVNATFTGDVIVPTPDGDTEAANKSYVDTAINELEGDINAIQQTVTTVQETVSGYDDDISAVQQTVTELGEDVSEVQQSVMQQTGTIDILSQTLSAITQGTMALPYVKKSGDTMSGELIVDGANGQTKISGGYIAVGDDNEYINILGSTSALEIKTDDNSYANIRLADPVEDNDAATKRYVDNNSNIAIAHNFGQGENDNDDNLEASLMYSDFYKFPTKNTFNSLTLYGKTEVASPTVYNLTRLSDGYYNAGGDKLTDENGIAFVFDVEKGISTYYVSYRVKFNETLTSLNYSYAITEYLEDGSVYGTYGGQGAVPNITIKNTNNQPSATTRIAISIYGTPFEQATIGEAIEAGYLVVGNDYIASPDHPKEIISAKTTEDTGVIYSSYSFLLAMYLALLGAQDLAESYLTERQQEINISNELNGFTFKMSGFNPTLDSKDGIDIFTNGAVGTEATLMYATLSDKYDYANSKYTKNIGSIVINGENANSVLSLAQIPTYIVEGTTVSAGTPIDAIKISVDDCISGNPLSVLGVVSTEAGSATDFLLNRAFIAAPFFEGTTFNLASSHFEATSVDAMLHSIVSNQGDVISPVNFYDKIFYGISMPGDFIGEYNNAEELSLKVYSMSLDGGIYFISDKITTVEQAVSYFTSNPLVVKYILNELEEYAIPEDDLLSYNNLNKRIESNVITSIIVAPKNEEETSSSMSLNFAINYNYDSAQNTNNKINRLEYILEDKINSDIGSIAEKRRQITSWPEEGYTFSSRMSYNTLYIFDTTTAIPALTIESFLAPSDTTYVYTYHFIFRSGATPTVLTLPDEVILPDGFEIEANRIYEINIMENLLSYQSWPVN